MVISRQRIKELYADKHYQSYFDVGLFFVLIFSFHVLYSFWNHNLDYWPIKGIVDKLFVWASALLFDQSTWVLDHVFRMDFFTRDQTIGFLNNEGNYSFVTVAPECTSLKQWMHWLFLMLIFPGPWKHKAWYIPLGLVIIEFTNVVRIVGISLFLRPYPHDFALAHDVIFKIMFYVVIFLMWAVWNDYFHHRKDRHFDRSR
jgi:Transmembrane exosortase (Exosortase_EpsH).